MGSGTLVTFGYDGSDFNGVLSDTFVTSNAPTAIYENYGYIAVNSIPDTTVALLRFDVSGLPPGATITGAQLRVAVFKNPSPSSNFGFVLAGDGSDYVDFKPATVGSGVRPQLSVTYE